MWETTIRNNLSALIQDIHQFNDIFLTQRFDLTQIVVWDKLLQHHLWLEPILTDSTKLEQLRNIIATKWASEFKQFNNVKINIDQLKKSITVINNTQFIIANHDAYLLITSNEVYVAYVKEQNEVTTKRVSSDFANLSILYVIVNTLVINGNNALSFNAFRQLLQLISIQSSDTLQNMLDHETNKLINKLSPAMTDFITHLKYDEFFTLNSFTNINLLNLIFKLRQHLPLTLDEYTILMHSPDVRYLIASIIRDNLSDALITSELPDNILNDLNKGLELYRSNYRENVIVNNVYQFNHQSSIDTTKYKHHQLLCHGTINESLLSIMKLGLMPSSQLTQQDINHHYTGSGLGNGVYFTWLNQIAKSINYSSFVRNDGEQGYLILANVYYNNKIKTDHYSTYQLKDGDLLIAEKVGGNDLDELMVNNSAQIQLKYLIELKSRNNN